MRLFSSGWIRDLIPWLTSRGLSHAARSAQEFLKTLLQNLLHEETRRLKKLALSYAVAVALGLFAVISVCAALVDGLAALGMPPWASHLLLATAAGLLSWIVFDRASVAAAADDGEESAAPDGIAIRIIHETRRPPARDAGKKVRRVERPARKARTRRKKKVARTGRPDRFRARARKTSRLKGVA